jgi:hypothetical protein
MGAELLFEVVSRAYERLSMIDLRVMGPESEVFLTLFKSSIYVLPFVAQGVGKKRRKGGQERGVVEGEKAPEKGPPHLTDVWCLEMVPEPKVRRDVDGGTL